MSMEQKEHLKDLLNLPSLAVLEKRRETLKAGVILVAGHHYTEADLDRQLEQWRLRDAIQATRPDGCWCLGLGGGRGQKVNRDGLTEPSEYCSCPDGISLAAEIANATQTKRVLANMLRQERKWEAAQIPLRFREMRLATSPVAFSSPEIIGRLSLPLLPRGITDASEKMDDITASEWQEYEVREKAWMGSWFFWGPYGSGKTGLAVGLAYARLERDLMFKGNDQYILGTILFTTVPAMLSELRSTYGRLAEGQPTEQAILRKYIDVDLLILDDIGVEQVKDTGWVEDRLYQVIGERHDDLRSTIFTSNLSLEELAKRIGQRIVWRIAEMCGPANIVEVKGKNLRA